MTTGSTPEWGWAPSAQRWYRATRFLLYFGVLAAFLFSGQDPIHFEFVVIAILLGILSELPALRIRWAWPRFFGPAGWAVIGAGFLWNAFAHHRLPALLGAFAVLSFLLAAMPGWVLSTLKCPNCAEPFFRREPPKWDSPVYYPLTTRTCANCGVAMGKTADLQSNEVHP